MTKPKRIRIKDIAEKSGVSSMTVSRVFSQDAKVSEETRRKVLLVAKELNYQPNVSARQLASTKSFILGILYDNPSASYVGQFLLGTLKSCRAIGYHLIVHQADEDIAETVRSVKELIETTHVDGLILLQPVCNEPEVIKILKDSNIPFVRISPNSDFSSSPYISMDDYQAAFELTEVLVKQGHTKIGHIIGHPNFGESRHRYQGFLDALRSNEIDVPPSYIEQGFYSYKSGITAADKLLSLAEKPTAIFASNDDMAAATIATAHMKNIDVPSELSVVGFDDTQLATIVWPHITTVKQPITETADLAVEMLSSGKFSDLSKVNSQEFRHVLEFEIIERGSSAPLSGKTKKTRAKT